MQVKPACSSSPAPERHHSHEGSFPSLKWPLIKSGSQGRGDPGAGPEVWPGGFRTQPDPGDTICRGNPCNDLGRRQDLQPPVRLGPLSGRTWSLRVKGIEVLEPQIASSNEYECGFSPYSPQGGTWGGGKSQELGLQLNGLDTVHACGGAQGSVPCTEGEISEHGGGRSPSQL